MNGKLVRGLFTGVVAGLLLTMVMGVTSWAESFYFKKGATVTVKKEIFICDNARAGFPGGPRDFECSTFYNLPSDDPDDPFEGIAEIPLGPATGDLGQYVPCSSVDGCRATASDFGAGIYKELVAIPKLSSEGIKTNLNKIHYAVTEDGADDIWDRNDDCAAAGFRHQLSVGRVQANGLELVRYDVCVDYSDDCAGTIRNYEKKTCTIKNYIFRGRIGERE